MSNIEEAKELLRSLFSQKGILAKSNPTYEEREGQKSMAEQILHAYFHKEISITEAGTGIGKSLAYLSAAMFWASNEKERTVISTHTIALQHQLLEKEIPFLQKALDLDIKVVLVKGMQNYLCLRKLEELELTEDEIVWDRMHDFASSTISGCRSTLPFAIPSAQWDRYGADRDSCSRSRCPHFKECFFFKAKKEAEDASLLIVNHYLLLTDLADKQEEEHSSERSILPLYQRLIIDEAHHVEDVALDVFSNRCDWISLIKLMHKILMHRETPDGKIQVFEKIMRNKKEALFSPIVMQRDHILKSLERAFFALRQFLDKQCTVSNKHDRSTLGYKKTVEESWIHIIFWKETIIPLFHESADLMMQWTVSLQNLLADIEEKEASLCTEMLHLLERLEQRALFLKTFFSQDPRERDTIFWIEKDEGNIHLVQGILDVSNKMEKILFSAMDTTALCSATLSSGNQFTFLRKRLGIDTREDVLEGIYPSPFAFASRTLFMVIDDLPDPSDFYFTKYATQAIAQIIEKGKGGAFVLFTSNEMLKEVHGCLLANPMLDPYPLFKQGDLSRELLIEKFRSTEGGVLLGVDSFWEGVDVPGDALKIVILVKLPFHPFQDPLSEALQEQIRLQGGNPFYDYSLPKAIIKFKQGFGRLMRNKKDRGVVICLDKRIYTKPYGKKFLNALPSCPQQRGSMEEIVKKTASFFANTE